VRIDIGARTDVGCVREGNEDNYRVVSDLNLFILSDGIGGEAHGEVASEMAVNTVEEHCHEGAQSPSLPLEGERRPNLSDRTNRLASAVRRANRLIHEAAAADQTMRGMGATIVTAWLDGDKLSLAHVGDSRAYRLRAGVLEQLTRDHSLVSEQVRLGILTPEQAERSEYQTMLIRALGAAENVDVDVDEHVLLPGDYVMLCSDGLSRMVRDEMIARTIVNSGNAQNTVDTLV
jgi:PPM family protein phosphatase